MRPETSLLPLVVLTPPKTAVAAPQATHRLLIQAQRAQRAQHVNLLLHRVLTAVLHKLDAALFSRAIGGESPRPPPSAARVHWCTAATALASLFAAALLLR